MYTEAFTQALYNLIDLKIIDTDEYLMLGDWFTTTEELDAYLTAREDISFWHIGGTYGRMTVLWIWQWFMGVSVALWGA